MKKSIFTALVDRGKPVLLSTMLVMTTLLLSGCPGPGHHDVDGGGGGGGGGGGEKLTPPKTLTIEEVVEKAGPSVVNIVSNEKSGSGVIYTQEGYVITNDHVVRGANSLEVHLSDKRTLKAKMIGTDSRRDIAVIKVEGDNLQEATFADSKEVKIGTEVVAIGNARGVENSATKGVISNLDVDVNDGTNITKCLQTDAPINPGNSGGALVNMHAEVIGINAMKRTDSESINYAIPANDVLKIARQLIDKGYVSWAYLGVEGINEKTKDDVHYIRINNIMPDSPAAKAGLQKNDIIINVNDIRVETVSKLRDQCNISGIDSMVSVYIKRGNEEGTVQVKLEELPKGYYTIDWS